VKNETEPFTERARLLGSRDMRLKALGVGDKPLDDRGMSSTPPILENIITEIVKQPMTR